MTDTQETVKVMVVDDQQLMRDGISSLLSIQAGIELVGTASDGQDGLQRRRAAHVVDGQVEVVEAEAGVADREVRSRQRPGNANLALATMRNPIAVVGEALHTQWIWKLRKAASSAAGHSK